MKTRFYSRVLCAFALISTLSACAQNSRFYWGEYEHKLYVYSKKPDAREDYRTALLKAIEKGESKSAVAPGFYAELGYLYLQDERLDLAIEYFQKEVSLFPESRPFLSSVIENLDGQASTNSEHSTGAADDEHNTPSAEIDLGV